MKRKIYKLISSAKLGLFTIALLVSAKAHSQVTYTYVYTGAAQTLTLPVGLWGIECWGGNGGDVTAGPGGGGKGGYSKGELNVLTQGTLLNILVGGKGANVNGSSGPSGTGGWNGGGGGGYCGKSAGGGGGASDVRVGGTTATNRIIVAGGGGGAAYYNQLAVGGHGGAQSGQNGNFITSGNVLTVGGGGAGANGSAPGIGGTGYPLTNGSATGGGGGGHSPGGFGQPGTGGGAGGAGGSIANGSTGSSGGGGGGYAGGAGGTQTSNAGVAGGGGSAYIGGVTSGTTIMFGQTGFVTNPDVSGNGRVIITELCSITLSATGINSNGAICAGSSVTLTTNAVSGYSWSTGASSSSIVVSPVTTTVYSLTAISPSNCTSSAQLTVTVNSAIPTLTVANTASASSGICPTKSVVLTASGATTYTWTGGTPVTNGVAFFPTTTSGYTVTGENACGTATAATSVSIHVAPTTGTVISQPTLCSGQTVTLTGVGNATNYVWSGGVPNGATFYPQVSGSFTVTGTSAQGCTSTAVAFLTVVTTPIAQPLASPPLICIGSSSTLTATGASNYTWTTPSGTFSTSSIIVSPLVLTTYTVTKANSNCVNTQTLSVLVNLLPQISAVANPSIACASKTLQLQAVGAQTYTWTGPAFTSTLNSPITSANVSTIYTLTASDGTCINTTTVPLTINPNPTITVVATTTAICRGDSVTMDASGGLTYTWTTPTGTLGGQTIKESPATSTLFLVTGVNQYTCYTTASQVVIVNPTPTLNAQTTKPLVCPNGVSSLTVTGANTYSWDANTGGATGNIISVNPSVTTVYTATGYYVPTMCFSTKTIQVNVFQPTFATNSPTSSCFGGTINLIASGAISYTWNGTQPFSQIAVSPPTPTFYVVSATSGSNGVNCVSTQTVQVSIYVNPTITAAADRTVICKGEIVKLTGGGGTTYNWGNNVFGTTVTFSPTASAPFYVTGTDQNGCIGTSSISIKVSPCIGIGELNNIASNLSVYPNPNAGHFIIKANSQVSLTVHNDLGQLIKVLELNETNNFQSEITGLAAGIYFVAGEGISEKIVVTR